jgi:hypothetical protein
MERMDTELEEDDYQGIQQFIADSPWDHTTLMAQIAREADGMLGRISAMPL